MRSDKSHFHLSRRVAARCFVFTQLKASEDDIKIHGGGGKVAKLVRSREAQFSVTEAAAAAATESSEAAVVKEDPWPACHERQSGRKKCLCDDEQGCILLALK